MSTEEGYTDRESGFRPFDPSKLPASPEILALIEEMGELARIQEPRSRRRRPVDQKIYEDALSAILCDLIHCHLERPGTWVTVELSKKDLGPRARRAPFMTEAFPTLLRCLAEAGVADVVLGYRNPFGSARTKAKASELLANRIESLGIGYADLGRNPRLQGEPIILRVGKGSTKRDVSLPMTDEVARLRAEMNEINGWIAEAAISWEGEEDVDIGRRFLRRIFHQGRLDRGGRLYFGFWQDLPSEDRLAKLMISGSPVVSIDFDQMAVHLAYAKIGATPPVGDLYAHPRFPREGVKLMLTAMLAAEAPFRRMPSGARRFFRAGISVDELISELAGQHPALKPLFFQGNSHEAMFQESQITVRALLALKARRVVALPIHDCLLVPKEALQSAMEELRRACREEVGRELPVTVTPSGS